MVDRRWREFGGRLRLFLTAWFGFVSLVVFFLLVNAVPAFYQAYYDVRIPVCISPMEQERAHAFLEQAMRDAGVERWSLGEVERSLEGCTGYDQKVLQFEGVLPFRRASILFGHISEAGPRASVYDRGLSYSTSPADSGGIAYGMAALASALLALGFWWVVRRRAAVRDGEQHIGMPRLLGGAVLAAGLAFVLAVAYGFVLQLTGIIHAPERSATDTLVVTPLLLLVGAVLAPIAEEVIFRFWLLARMVPAIGTLGALLLSSVAFSLVHMDVEPFALGSRLITGLALGLLWLRTRSLGACVLAHGLFNAAVIGLTHVMAVG